MLFRSVRIDRKRKFLATVFLRALGLRGADEILRTFYSTETLVLKNGRILWKVSDSLVGRRSAQELAIPGSDLALHAGKKIRKDQVEALKKARALREAKELDGAQALAKQIEKAGIAIAVKTGEGGKLFGAVTTADLHDKLAAEIGRAHV